MIEQQKSPFLSEYSPTGLIDLVSLFSKTPANPPLALARELTKKIRQEDYINNKQLRDNMTAVWKFVNTLYLVNYCQARVLVPELNHSVADRKVVRVLFAGFKVVLMRQARERIRGWSKHWFGEFMGLLGKLIDEELNKLVKEKPSNQDLDSLQSLDRLMKTPLGDKNSSHSLLFLSNRQRYSSIIQSIAQKQIKFNEIEMKTLFENQLNILYAHTDNCIKQMLEPTKLKLQKLKLFIFYLRVALQLSDKKLSRKSQNSKISTVMEEEGYEILQRYFDDLIMKIIVQEKESLRRAFHSDTETVVEGNPSSEESSERKKAGKGKEEEDEESLMEIQILKPK